MAQKWYHKATVQVAIVMGIFSLIGIMMNIFSPKRNQSSQSSSVEESPNANLQQMQNSPGSTQQIINITSPISNVGEDKIKLTFRYAYDFDNFKGSTHTDENKIIESGDVLRKRFTPDGNVRLTFGVGNFNEGIPFDNVLLQILFPDEVNVTGAEGWTIQLPNKRYSWSFKRINNTPLNANSIFVKFQRPGSYRILAYIDGSYAEMIEVPFIVEIYQ